MWIHLIIPPLYALVRFRADTTYQIRSIPTIIAKNMTPQKEKGKSDSVDHAI